MSLEEDLRRKAEQQLAQEISKKESEMNEIIKKKEVGAHSNLSSVIWSKNQRFFILLNAELEKQKQELESRLQENFEKQLKQKEMSIQALLEEKLQA